MTDSAGGSVTAPNPTVVTSDLSTAELQELLDQRREEYEAGADDRLIDGLETSLAKFEGHVAHVKEQLKAAKAAKKEHAAAAREGSD